MQCVCVCVCVVLCGFLHAIRDIDQSQGEGCS